MMFHEIGECSLEILCTEWFPSWHVIWHIVRQNGCIKVGG